MCVLFENCVCVARDNVFLISVVIYLFMCFCQIVFLLFCRLSVVMFPQSFDAIIKMKIKYQLD